MPPDKMQLYFPRLLKTSLPLAYENESHRLKKVILKNIKSYFSTTFNG